jgi:hypothetical protein
MTVTHRQLAPLPSLHRGDELVLALAIIRRIRAFAARRAATSSWGTLPQIGHRPQWSPQTTEEQERTGVSSARHRPSSAAPVNGHPLGGHAGSTVKVLTLAQVPTNAGTFSFLGRTSLHDRQFPFISR